MRVLVACEYSGRVRKAFRDRDHRAYSCDLLPAEDGSPYHFQGDVFEAIKAAQHMEPLDLLIAHPPCTHLAVSGSRWFPEKRASGEQQRAIDFFLALAMAPIPRIAIENPICIMSSVWREPDQIIQPWQFGHGETKATCLWLKGLPPLRPTNVVAGRKPRVHFMPPGPNRWKERSRTYEGIADAMAAQWGSYTDLVTMMETSMNTEERATEGRDEGACADWIALKAENDRLRAALQEAADSIESQWSPYLRLTKRQADALAAMHAALRATNTLENGT